MQGETQLTTRPQVRTRERLRYFDNFRAVSILLVVAGHCYWAWDRGTVPEIVGANLVTGGTALFVFISGFFFHYAFYRNFNYRRFMTKKALAVGVPYLVLSSLLLVILAVWKREIPFPIGLSDDPWTDNLLAVVANLATGRTSLAYWYIPFIMLMFAMSPLFIRFLEARTRTQALIVAAALLLAMVVARPALSVNTFHSVVYFAGFYLLGMLYSLHRERTDEVLARIPVVVLWAVVGLVALGSALAGQVGLIQKWEPWEPSALDWMVPLKLVTIAAMLATLKRYADREYRLLGYIAEASFAIFFIHPIVLLGLGAAVPEAAVSTPPTVAGLFLVVMLVTLGVIWAVKKALGSRSRYVIGY